LAGSLAFVSDTIAYFSQILLRRTSLRLGLIRLRRSLVPDAWLNTLTNSSDAGEPLFPDSVEAMRLVRGYMEAFGLNRDELYTVCTRSPARVVGFPLA